MAYAVNYQLDALVKENVAIRKDYDAIRKDYDAIRKDNESIRKDNESIRKDNAELREILSAYAGQIERNKDAICQLYGGLYNPANQKRILNEHLNTLIGAPMDEESDDDISDDDEDIWPTTRQGDEHERRLRETEEKLQQMEIQVALMEERQIQKLASK